MVCVKIEKNGWHPELAYWAEIEIKSKSIKN